MNQKFNKRSNERYIFWAQTIQTWMESNLTQSEYCRKNNLDEQLFSKWKIRLQKANKKKSVKFVEIKTGSSDAFSSKDDIELVVNDKYKIKIKPDFNKDSLKNILSLLGDEK
jgi:hypothetical protein